LNNFFQGIEFHKGTLIAAAGLVGRQRQEGFMRGGFFHPVEDSGLRGHDKLRVLGFLSELKQLTGAPDKISFRYNEQGEPISGRAGLRLMTVNEIRETVIKYRSVLGPKFLATIRQRKNAPKALKKEPPTDAG
jgi:hypothetical protein